MSEKMEELKALKVTQEEALKSADSKSAKGKAKKALNKTIKDIETLAGEADPIEAAKKAKEAAKKAKESAEKVAKLAKEKLDKELSNNPKLCGDCKRKYGGAFCNSCVVLSNIKKEALTKGKDK